MVPAYMSGREDLAEIAEYIAKKRETVNETESCAARRALASALLLVAIFASRLCGIRVRYNCVREPGNAFPDKVSPRGIGG